MAQINKQSTTYWSRLSDGFPIEISIDEEYEEITNTGAFPHVTILGAGNKCNTETMVIRLREIADIIEQLQIERNAK